MTSNTTHYLDYNKHAPIGLELVDGSLRVDVTNIPGFRLRQNIGKALSIATPDGMMRPAFSMDPSDGRSLIMEGENPSATSVPVGNTFSLNLYGEVLGTYEVDDTGKISQLEGSHRPLTASETRRLGTSYREQGAPFNLRDVDSKLVETAKKAVTTDFHTHSSGQISPEGLLDVALKHDVHYPVRLLEEMGIHPTGERKTIPRVFFAALDSGKDIPKEEEGVSLESLTPEEFKALSMKMQMPIDRQATFTEMEYDAYRYRYPIAKPPEVQVDVLKKVAEEYAQQGIQHAEIAYTSLDNPAVFRNVHKAMAEMESANAEAEKNGEEKPYADLSFLFAIPRTFSQEKIADMLERTKSISRSPYVTGIDFIGYETNKTEDFSRVLDPFLEWAQEHNPNLILRVHAGENAKNRSNVHDVLELAKTHNIHTRIGHGIYGLTDDHTLKLAEELAASSKLTIELNPDSNIALNNIDKFDDLPFKMLVDRNIPFVIGSDSSGMYATDREQLGLAGLYGGLDERGFSALEAQQNRLVKQHRMTADEKCANIHDWDTTQGREAFLLSVENELTTLPNLTLPDGKKDFTEQRKALRESGKLLNKDEAVSTLQGRKPIAIVGASGASWQDIKDPEQRARLATAIDMLVQVLNPEETYILQGRSKATGIGKLIQKSVAHANQENASGRRRLDTVGIIAQPQYDRQNAFDNLDHLIEIEGGLIDVADQIVNHVVGKNGTLVGAGGSAFTRDIILKADHRMSARDTGALMLMDCAEQCNNLGASSEKARMLHPHYRVNVSHGKSQEKHDGRQMIINLHGLIQKGAYPNIFVDGFDPTDEAALNKLAAESRARVDSYNLDTPETTDQMVESGQTLARGKDKGEGR